VSSRAETIEFIEDQLRGLDIRSGKMFGEYVLYCDGKVVGFVCDDTLFIKPSAVDPAVLEGTVPGKPYPGAKDYHEVPGDLIEDAQWLTRAIRETAAALPVPPPKKPRVPRSSGSTRATKGGSGA
jgi:TfoX/Sxy family transcriptional regulator of competence genes